MHMFFFFLAFCLRFLKYLRLKKLKVKGEERTGARVADVSWHVLAFLACLGVSWHSWRFRSGDTEEESDLHHLHTFALGGPSDINALPPLPYLPTYLPNLPCKTRC